MKKILDHIVKNSDIVINTIGILYSKGSKNTFQNIHVNFPNLYYQNLAKNIKLKNLFIYLHLALRNQRKLNMHQVN